MGSLSDLTIKIISSALGAGVSYGATAFFYKKWFEARIIVPVEEVKKRLDDLEKTLTERIDRVSSHVLKTGADQSEMNALLMGNSIKVLEKISDTASQVSKVSRDYDESQKRLQVIEAKAEEANARVIKLHKVAVALNEQDRAIRSEVLKINDELIIIKKKKD